MAFLAAVKLGIVPVLVNSLLSAGELVPIVEQARTVWVFTEAACADCGARVAPGLDSSSVVSPGRRNRTRFPSRRWYRNRGQCS